jgi:hypothetical protein
MRNAEARVSGGAMRARPELLLSYVRGRRENVSAAWACWTGTWAFIYYLLGPFILLVRKGLSGHAGRMPKTTEPRMAKLALNLKI